MTWTINPIVTINGSTFTTNTVGAISINYGRTSVWDFQQAGYASINLVNLVNTDFGIDINDTVTVKLPNATNTANITVFTGQVTQVTNNLRLAAGSTFVVDITISAIAPLAILARTQVGKVAYSSQNESERITTILAETSASIDVIDSGTYTLTSRAINPNNALALCNAYALTATGSIYETTSGKVGYANELRRNTDVANNGYFDISTSYINQNNLKSQMSLGDVINNVQIKYNGSSYFNTTSSGSIASYGTIAGTLETEISNEPDANTLGGIYLGMRAYPQTSLSTLEVRLSDPDVDATTLNKMLNMYFGLPVQVSSLPLSIYPSTYYGFVEGWNLQFNNNSAKIALRTTQKTYSFRYTQWEDVAPPSLTWNGVAALLQWIDYQ